MTISALPTPPSPLDTPAEFNTKAFNLLGALPDFVTEANALSTDVNAKSSAATLAASSASSSATSASNSATAAAASATSASNSATSASGSAAFASAEADRAESAAAGSAMPVGMIAFFGASAAPAGWLKANGAAISRSTYAALFAAIGTVYGAGDGSTTFNLPDLRGEFVRGFDDGRGVDTGRVLGSAQADEFKSHQHQVLNSTSTSITAGSFGRLSGNLNNSSGDGRPTEFTGGTETRPRNIAMLACIKY